MAKYLVTGGLGVVGSLLSRQLLEAGDTVRIVDACEEKRNDWVARDLIDRYPRVSVWRRRLEKGGLRQHLDDADLVVHAAAHTGIPHSAEDPADDWASNVDATRVLLEELRAHGRKIPTVVMSSVKPYRVHDLPVVRRGDRWEWEDGGLAGIHESWPLEPDEPYAASKMAQSALAMAYARTYDLPVVTLRFSNLYGPAPCHGPRHGWYTWFCIQEALGLDLEVQGTGLQVRDLLYSSDINRALRLGLEHAHALAGQVFNVGGGPQNSLSVLEAAKKIAKSSCVVLKPDAGRKNEDPIFKTDFASFSQATGWRPEVSPEAGAELVVQWARDNAHVLREVYSWLPGLR